MADTPWGQTAEMQWTKCLYLKDMAAADPDYQKRCIICREKVFHVEDDIPRMKGHIYSSAGMSEFGITQMCEFCFDVSADLFDDVTVSLVKIYPHDSPKLWLSQRCPKGARGWLNLEVEDE
jgi:hypothetical protein